MTALPAALRRQLEKCVLAARASAEGGAAKTLRALGVHQAEAPSHLAPRQRELREELQAQSAVLGDRSAQGGIAHLVEKIAYDHWHRLRFSRFLLENGLFMHPEHDVPLGWADLQDLAAELPPAARADEWTLAARFTAALLPAIFRSGDPAGELTLPGEDRAELLRLLKELPADTFRADDALGWVYQFWQAHWKDEINAAQSKSVPTNSRPSPTFSPRTTWSSSSSTIRSASGGRGGNLGFQI